MTGRWRKQLLKVADICVTMPFNDSVWNNCNFEPLIIVIIILFHNAPPWKLKHTSFVRESEMKLQVLWKDDFFLGRDLLCELFKSARTLGSLPRNMVRGMFKGAKRGRSSCGKTSRRGRILFNVGE